MLSSRKAKATIWIQSSADQFTASTSPSDSLGWHNAYLCAPLLSVEAAYDFPLFPSPCCTAQFSEVSHSELLSFVRAQPTATEPNSLARLV